jgi:hypothetical protein
LSSLKMRRIASVPNWSLNSRLSMTYALTGFLPFILFRLILFHAEVGRSSGTAGFSWRLDRTNKRVDDPSYLPGE